MSAEKIHGPSLQQQQGLRQFQRIRQEPARAEGERGASAAEAKEAPGRAELEEKVEISDQARRLQDLRAAVDAGREALATQPDVRADAVATARRHLEAGALDTAEARDATAARLEGVLVRLHRLLD